MNLADSVVVWGNCQAEPIADLLRAPLASHGLRVEVVPPVFLADEPALRRVRQLVSTSAFLISQPIADEYRVPGCATNQLAAGLPPAGRLVTFPVVFHVGPFPYQVNAHGDDGTRVDAPLTDYHDLRAVVAVERGLTTAQALSWWPAPSVAAVRAISAESHEELRRRETALDVRASPWLDDPRAMMTISHPSNSVLAAVATALLRRMGFGGDGVAVPTREFLGARRAPVEAAVRQAHGWPPEPVDRRWRVDGRAVELEEILDAQLPFYRARPDIVRDTRRRYRRRLRQLGL